MFKKILLGLVVLVAAFAAYVAVLPAHFEITRSATIAAPAPVVFAQVNDLHNWQAWSPWVKLDPAAKNTFSGPPAGVGAVFAWAGNSQVGEGSMTITESTPDELVRFRLDFLKPMPGTSISEFTFQPEGRQTAVTWTMSGENNFLARAVCVFLDMDKLVGGDFEKGLASLNEVSQAAAKK